jgi:hypothetical protein
MADVEKLIEKMEEDDDVMCITPWKKRNFFLLISIKLSYAGVF